MSNQNEDQFYLYLREADDKARKWSRKLEDAARRARELLASDEFQIHFQWIESAIKTENDDCTHHTYKMNAWEEAYGGCAHALEVLANAMREIGNATTAASALARMCASHMKRK